MNLRNLKLVTFDATNTLIQFKLAPWQFYASAADAYGYKGTKEDIKKNLIASIKLMDKEHPNYGLNSISWQNWWTEVVRRTLQDHLPASANLNVIAMQLINDFKSSKCWQVANSSQNLINHFKSQNISVGVISNFDPRLNDVLENVSLTENLDFILTSYNAGVSKPDRRIFDIALQMTKNTVKPSEALHIGDDLEKDYEGAIRAGWHAVLINSNMKCKGHPRKEHVFSSLEELYDTIKVSKLTF